MENYLYFATGAPNDSGANEEVVMIPASRLTHFEIAGTASLDLWFESGVSQETNIGDGDISPNHTRVNLVITATTHKAVMQTIANAISDGAANDGFTVIADGENSIFIHSGITACNAIEIIGAS